MNRPDPLLRERVYLPELMTARLHRLAIEASRLLACEVPRSTVVRAAVAAWLEDAEQQPTDVVMQAIRLAVARSATRLRSYPQHWPAAMVGRLDRLAQDATRLLGCRVSRSCVARAAVGAWIDAAEKRPPSLVAEAIKAALVPRGRRAQR